MCVYCADGEVYPIVQLSNTNYQSYTSSDVEIEIFFHLLDERNSLYLKKKLIL